jgi:thioredoxin reductase
MGRRGTPRRLGVPGEHLSKVVYRLIDAAQYRGQRVIVSGGGDSALEAALALADEPETEVTLCYRGDVFNRARKSNREGVAAAAAAGRLDLRMATEITESAPASVTLVSGGKSETIANDNVIVCAGGILPADFLQSSGVKMARKFGTA